MSLQGGCSLKPERNAHGFTSLFLMTTVLLKYLRFLKARCLLINANKSPDSVILPTQGKKRVWQKHSQNTLP